MSEPTTTTPRLILASGSPRRRELIRFLGVPHQVIPSTYEEVVPETHPEPASLAVELASAKALDVSRSLNGEHAGALVLGADTIVALAERVYGKPTDAEDAIQMLSELSGKTHQVITGVALARGGEVVHTFAARTDVVFRKLHETEIDAYVALGESLDKAGSYGGQGYGAILIEEIRGDYPNVVGLPLTALALALRELGVPVLGVP
jgi:septum formation protein